MFEIRAEPECGSPRPPQLAEVALQSEAPIEVTEGVAEQRCHREATLAQIGVRNVLPIEKWVPTCTGIDQRGIGVHDPMSVRYGLPDLVEV